MNWSYKSLDGWSHELVFCAYFVCTPKWDFLRSKYQPSHHERSRSRISLVQIRNLTTYWNGESFVFFICASYLSYLSLSLLRVFLACYSQKNTLCNPTFSLHSQQMQRIKSAITEISLQLSDDSLVFVAKPLVFLGRSTLSAVLDRHAVRLSTALAIWVIPSRMPAESCER